MSDIAVEPAQHCPGSASAVKKSDSGGALRISRSVEASDFADRLGPVVKASQVGGPARPAIWPTLSEQGPADRTEVGSEPLVGQRFCKILAHRPREACKFGYFGRARRPWKTRGLGVFSRPTVWRMGDLHPVAAVSRQKTTTMAEQQTAGRRYLSAT